MSTLSEAVAAKNAWSSSSAQPIRILRAGGPTSAQIRLFGNSIAAKDFHHTSVWFRTTVAGLLIRYEAYICRRLGPLDGLPEFIGRPDSCTLLFEFVEGENCRKTPPDQLHPLFFQQLQALLAAVRSRGVLHLDVGRNVLHSTGGRPFLCDFAACLNVAWLPQRLRRSLVGLRERYDLREISKLKMRRAPHLLNCQDHKRIAELLPMERLLKPLARLQKLFLRRLNRALGGGP